MDFTDQTKPVRQGEELDRVKLEYYLQEHVPGSFGPLVVEQFPKGHSNLTYLLRVGNRELVLRRPPFGTKVKTAHDMGREYRILSCLHGVFSPAPQPLLYCEDTSVMGAPFYVMERIKGIILRKDPPAGLDLSAEKVRKLCESFIDTLAELHNLDYKKAGLGELGKPEGYVERQVKGWTERYYGSQTDDIPEVVNMTKWLAERIPDESGEALIHNDYKYDNTVLDPQDVTKVIGVLDWEMSTVGDPLMDLGTAVSYWVEPGDDEEMQFLRFGPTTLPGSMTRKELIKRYEEKTERNVAEILFYYCFALFKTAVIAQQIYYRYAKGLTKDDRFAAMIMGVRILSKAAVRAAERGNI